ncbi:MAG: hypothetical protein E5Y10_05455 [Mesorhizobium sp.]|uniref:hypothetical protein n=1 Tax=Mesorhizobium sp. TaxID=1871066 RepID=UPI001223206E|nr:hypothetical protein [Mesorhizobium sp.]TIN43082.1 MAG: hypothetical protein E5Y13_04795 [Mesorhizobium sp.]TJU92010.1 MAG: hypothetical protein E5Y10_05455 [Mesorhizobium sp.]
MQDAMISMPEQWYTLSVADGVDPDLPGIYEWQIEGAGSYIGRYTHSSRPLDDYARHVRDQLLGGIYKPSNPDGWRRIHRELYAALLDGRNIELILVENCAVDQLNARERVHRKERGTINGRRMTLAECRRPKPMPTQG